MLDRRAHRVGQSILQLEEILLAPVDLERLRGGFALDIDEPSGQPQLLAELLKRSRQQVVRSQLSHRLDQHTLGEPTVFGAAQVG